MVRVEFILFLFNLTLVRSLVPGDAAVGADNSRLVRNTVTDEPLQVVGKPEGAAEYVPRIEPTDGQHLALTMHKLTHGIDPPRPFLIWALGSSYTNMLGNGEAWKEFIPKHFPKAPPVEYRKMVGNSCPWQYLRGWARHLVVPDQPDLILIYTIGKPDDLEQLILELRQHTTADIIVPSIHWRERDQELWGKSENAADQDVSAVREVCRRHQVEFVENRRDWAQYLSDNNLPISSLLKDAVHQSNYGASVINRNILSHLQMPESFSCAAEDRERSITPVRAADGSYSVKFVGNRIDLIGHRLPNGGRFTVMMDGQPAEMVPAFLMSYIQPGQDNSKARFGQSPTVPRDTAPHGVQLGMNVQPQTWTIIMTSDEGDFELTGSLTGPDGSGNAFQSFTSRSGQIIIDPILWRRAERNRTGDRFTFDVTRSIISEIDFQGHQGDVLVIRLAQALQNTQHTLKLVPVDHAVAAIDAFQVFQPPVTER